MSNDDETQRIGQRVAELRKYAGLSQDRLAEIAHVPPSQVQNIETAKHSPSVKTLAKVLGAMGYRLGIIPKD